MSQEALGTTGGRRFVKSRRAGRNRKRSWNKRIMGRSRSRKKNATHSLMAPKGAFSLMLVGNAESCKNYLFLSFLEYSS